MTTIAALTSNFPLARVDPLDKLVSVMLFSGTKDRDHLFSRDW
jgi:hypothetical protein